MAVVRCRRLQQLTLIAASSRFLFAFTVAVLATNCDSRAEMSIERYRPGSAREVLGVPMGVVRNAIAARLDSGVAPSWASKDDWIRVQRVYRAFGNAPLWLEPGGPKDRASALLAVLREAEDHALNTAAYPLDSVHQVVETGGGTPNARPRALADADVLLTAAYVAYATDMLMGQIDRKTVSQAWHIPARTTEVDSALVRTSVVAPHISCA